MGKSGTSSVYVGLDAHKDSIDIDSRTLLMSDLRGLYLRPDPIVLTTPSF
jgi:hypothetical protein